jgi:hypothetical protein
LEREVTTYTAYTQTYISSSSFFGTKGRRIFLLPYEMVMDGGWLLLLLLLMLSIPLVLMLLSHKQYSTLLASFGVCCRIIVIKCACSGNSYPLVKCSFCSACSSGTACYPPAVLVVLPCILPPNSPRARFNCIKAPSVSPTSNAIHACSM